MLQAARAVDRLDEQQSRSLDLTRLTEVKMSCDRLDLLLASLKRLDFEEYLRRAQNRATEEDQMYIKMFSTFKHNLNTQGRPYVARGILKIIWKYIPAAWTLFPSNERQYIESYYPPTEVNLASMTFWMSRADEALLRVMLDEIDNRRFIVPYQYSDDESIRLAMWTAQPWMLKATHAVRNFVQQLLDAKDTQRFLQSNAILALNRSIQSSDVVRHIIAPMVSSHIPRDTQPRIATDPRMRSLQVLNELDQTRVQPHTADAQKYQRVREIRDNLSQLDRESLLTRLREIVDGSAGMPDDDDNNSAALPGGLTQALRALYDVLQQNPHISRRIVYDELNNLLRTMPR